MIDKLGRDWSRRIAIKAFVETYYTEHGYSPTGREVGEHFGISTNVALRLMVKLVESEQLAAINKGIRYIVPLWVKENYGRVE